MINYAQTLLPLRDIWQQRAHTQTKIYKCFPCEYLQSVRSLSMKSVCTPLFVYTAGETIFIFTRSLPSSSLSSLSVSACLAFSSPRQEMSTLALQRKSILSVLWGCQGKVEVVVGGGGYLLPDVFKAPSDKLDSQHVVFSKKTRTQSSMESHFKGWRIRGMLEHDK